MKKITLLLLATASLLFAPGCASTLKGKADQLSPLVESASYVGAAFDLLSHPERRPTYEAVYAELDALVKGGRFDLLQFKAVLAKLPIKELRDSKTTLLIDTSIILFDNYTGQLSNLEGFKAEFLLPIASKVRDGLGRAIAVPTA